MSASDLSPDEWTFIQTGYATEKEFLAAQAELAAIRIENPRYNIAGKVGPRARILRGNGG